MSSDGVDEVQGEVGLAGQHCAAACLFRLRVRIAARPGPLTLSEPLTCGDTDL
jgi:hypothetical protein